MKKNFILAALILVLIFTLIIGYKKYSLTLTTAENTSKTLNNKFQKQLINDRLNNFDVSLSDIEAFPGGLVTFVDDDGFCNVWNKLLPIFKKRNVPCVVAMPTNMINQPDHLSSDNLLYLQNIGWEIASHSVNHLHLAELPEDKIEYELKESKNTLTNLKINCNSIVYPYGSVNNTVTQISEKYYESGIDITLGLNKVPLNKYLMYRVALGSYFNTTDNSNTLAFYKSQIDSAKKNNSWLIFMMHVNETDDTQLSYISEVIDYCNKLNIPIVNLNNGFNKSKDFFNKY